MGSLVAGALYLFCNNFGEQHMDDLYGVVDIGTNSVRLMLAEAGQKGVYPISKTLATTRIGEGMGHSRIISAAAMERSLQALASFQAQARQKGVKAFFVFATSAVREAENGRGFAKEAKERLGIDIDIISGEEEAKIGFIGAAGRDKRRGIIDIGGGSTEVVCGKNDTLDFVQSFRVGTVRALSLYPEADKAKDFSSARKWMEETIAGLKDLPALKNTPFIGIGGTATALASVALGLKEYKSEKVQGYILTKARLAELFDQLSGMDIERRKNLTGLDALRADVIVYGCLLLQCFLDVIGLEEIEVSDRDNQEGYLIKKLGL
jgi:exopolyphosphatase/guanosine-5'-triphosphate,3'-diphosphate pyrophosphatase